MREEKIARSKSKQRLLEAAESLFAERGFDAVSVRDITKLAGANVAAVNYHFGDRENLISLVITRHMEPVNDERLARLESVDRKGSGKAVVPLEELIEALVRPLASVTRKTALPDSLHHKLLGRVFALPPEAWPEALVERTRQMMGRFMRALAKALPSVPAEELVWRMHFVTGGMVHMLLFEVLGDESDKSRVKGVGLEVMLGRFIRFAAAGLREGVEGDIVKPKGPQATFNF